MRFVAYSSKLWYLFLAVLTGGFAALILQFWHRLPLPMQIGFSILLCGAFLALIFSLASSKPRLRIDEEGISCYGPFYATLSWADIIDAERVPRVEKITVGRKVHYRASFTEAWRPIDLQVADLEKYSRIIPARLHRLLLPGVQGAGSPGIFRLRLQLTGLSASSAAAMKVIQYYLERKKL